MSSAATSWWPPPQAAQKARSTRRRPARWPPKLDVHSAAVVGVDLAVEVAAEDEHVDELACRLAADSQSPDHVDGGADLSI
jgi:hypothetical protein